MSLCVGNARETQGLMYVLTIRGKQTPNTVPPNHTYTPRTEILKYISLLPLKGTKGTSELLPVSSERGNALASTVPPLCLPSGVHPKGYSSLPPTTPHSLLPCCASGREWIHFLMRWSLSRSGEGLPPSPTRPLLTVYQGGDMTNNRVCPA
jgi:hypothetical protein